MTRIEAQSVGGLGRERERGPDWSQLLVSIITAALVIALGLLLVGVTSDKAESRPTPSSATGVPLR